MKHACCIGIGRRVYLWAFAHKIRKGVYKMKRCIVKLLNGSNKILVVPLKNLLPHGAKYNIGAFYEYRNSKGFCSGCELLSILNI